MPSIPSTPSIPSVEGDVFEAGTARARPACLVWSHGRIGLAVDGVVTPLPPKALRVSSPVAGVARRVTWGDGRSFITRDDGGLSALLRAAQAREPGRWIAALEKSRWAWGMALVLLALLAGSRWGGMSVASVVVAAIPASVEKGIGARAFAALDPTLKPSRLPDARQKDLQARFKAVATAAGLPGDVALVLRHAPALGANALAFPGGPVLLTDDLVILAPADDALSGVLAHEAVHVRERHGMQRLVQAVGLTAVASLVTGDGGGLVQEAIALPALLLDRGYSRDMETRADQGAVAILARQGVSCRAFLALIQSLPASNASWLGSHPDPRARANAIASCDP